MKTTIDEMTKNTPVTQEVFKTLGFNLQWTYQGEEYLKHWATLTVQQKNQIDEAYIDDTMALDDK